jgi:hypothetical protein
MEDVPMRVEGANDDTIDPLDIMAGVAAQAAPAAKPKRKQVVAAVTKVGLVKCSRVGFLDMYAHFAASGNAGAVARLDDVLRTGGVKKLKKLVKKGEEEKYDNR